MLSARRENPLPVRIASPPKEVERQLTEVRRRSVELRAALIGLSLEAEQLLALGTAGTPRENVHWIARDALGSLNAACLAALQQVAGQDGRRNSGPLHHLINTLADILEKAGYSVDATESGHLSRLLTIILKDLGDPPRAELRKTLSRALADRGTRSPNR